MPHRFFRDEQFDFEIKIALGGVYYGCGDVGEILATAENIRDGHDDSWAAEWIGLATRVRSIAETCARDGRRVSAREAFLRAASYYANSFNVTLRNAKLDDDLLSNFQYRLDADTVGRITCPVLVTDPEGEEFWPGQSERLYDMLPGKREVVKFTAAEGADLHCGPMGRSLTDQRVFDWLDATLRRP